jgi:hypothetical protein
LFENEPNQLVISVQPNAAPWRTGPESGRFESMDRTDDRRPVTPPSAHIGAFLEDVHGRGRLRSALGRQTPDRVRS